MASKKISKAIGGVSSRRTAGALPRLKAAKRSPVLQPENYGYPIELALEDGEVLIKSGCRCLPLNEARGHWERRARETGMCKQLPPHNEDCIQNVRRRARKMIALLPLLAQRARRYGWATRSKTES